MTKKVVRNFGP